MESLLGPEDYLSPEVFAREQQRLFGRLWIFVGLRQLLTATDAFLTRTIGGVPIVVQRLEGRLRAFENQCRHRQMPLQFEHYGKRRLACRYHGWTYGADAAPASIPSRNTLYGFDATVCAGLQLREFALAEIGNLLFVNLAAAPLPLEDQFSASMLDQLAAVSGHFDHEMIHADVPARYNWKLNFENVLDDNHVRYLHPRSFQIQLGSADHKPAARISEAELVDVDLRALSYATQAPFDIKARAWHDKVRRFGDRHAYYNFFIYPNVNLISVGGLVFLLQQFCPVAPDRTEVRFSLMTAERTGRLPALPAILWNHLRGEKAVLDEDIEVLERLQASLHAGSRRAWHGAYERQLVKTAAVYRRLMQDAADA